MEDKNNELNNLSNDENIEDKLVDKNIDDTMEIEVVNNIEDINNLDDKEDVAESIEVKDVVKKPNNKKLSFFKRLMQNVIDESIILLIALALLFLSDLILRLGGLFIAQRVPFYFIVFVLANVLYAPILKSTKLNCTIGEKIIK